MPDLPTESPQVVHWAKPIKGDTTWGPFCHLHIGWVVPLTPVGSQITCPDCLKMGRRK